MLKEGKTFIFNGNKVSMEFTCFDSKNGFVEITIKLNDEVQIMTLDKQGEILKDLATFFNNISEQLWNFRYLDE